MSMRVEVMVLVRRTAWLTFATKGAGGSRRMGQIEMCR